MLKNRIHLIYYIIIYLFDNKFNSLTLANASRERQINFPAVSVNCFCDRKIISNMIRTSRDFKLYQRKLYIALLIFSLYKKRY